MAKHIALIHAGGTIGMAPTPNGLAPMPGFADLLDQALARCAAPLPRYTLLPLAQPIDSANATPQDWRTLAQEVSTRYQDYDGFVILHGTDTMAFSAAALSFMLQGLRKPVVLTGAQVPLSVPGNDALQNVIDALRAASAGICTEVAICFAGKLLRGNRSTKISASAFDAFDSPNHPPLARFADGELAWNAAALLPSMSVERFTLPEYGKATVLSLRFAPGLPLAALEALLACHPHALILDCYGSGNAPDRDPALQTILKQASDAGAVLLARTQCLHGKAATGAYAAGAALADAGVVSVADLGFEAAYAKMHHLFACGMSPAQVRQAIIEPLAGELSI